MKNIYVLPTDKPSRLYNCFSNLEIGEFVSTRDGLLVTNQNIYITSDEDINENDYIITKDGRLVQVSYLLSKDLQGASKVILTTDTKLIADGVQPIPDEFLEWFVKNPSCERVEVKKGFADGSAYGYDFLSYKIIIPKVSKPTSMENKTPMQELIEYIELNQPKNKITDGIWSKAKSLLEKEKELILNTFIDGEVNCGRQLAKDYYNEKFKNNEN